jgi:hypothetical protein
MYDPKDGDFKQEEVEGGEDEERDDEPGIAEALQSLPLFEDIFLRMQAMNLDLVDSYLQNLEAELLQEYIDEERTPLQSAVLVSGLSQLWIFGLYELLRTWRQRATGVIKFALELKGLEGTAREKKIAQCREKIRKESESALGKRYYWEPFSSVATDDNFVSHLQMAFDQTEVLFRRIEALRISLAKHEVPKSKGVIAMAPGYGRIDLGTGSIYWQIILKGNQVDLVSRREIADMCRHVAEDLSRLILPQKVQKMVAALKEEAYGLTRVTVILNDGTEYRNIFVAWNKVLLFVGGQESEPFDARQVVDIRWEGAEPTKTPPDNLPL